MITFVVYTASIEIETNRNYRGAGYRKDGNNKKPGNKGISLFS
jgi:hypothetical protein